MAWLAVVRLRRQLSPTSQSMLISRSLLGVHGHCSGFLTGPYGHKTPDRFATQNRHLRSAEHRTSVSSQCSYRWWWIAKACTPAVPLQ